MSKRPVIIGSGQYNYDIIKVREYPDGFSIGKRNSYTETILAEEVGGTCGNVMCMLAHMGWDARPQVKLIDSEEGHNLADSLKEFGCATGYISFSANGGFSGLMCTHRKNRNTGEHELGLRGFGPNGSRFRKITELRARDEVPQFLDSITDYPDVYFFDHNEAGPRLIANELRNRGTLIYYEAENNRDSNKFIKAVDVADIVKFSDENVPDIDFCKEFPDTLFIQTQGAKGMRFSLKGGEWINVNPVPVENVVDWEGCGDTVSAVFLNELYKLGLPKVSELTDEQVLKALNVAAEKSALNTQYYGSKGWIKAEKQVI